MFQIVYLLPLAIAIMIHISSNIGLGREKWLFWNRLFVLWLLFRWLMSFSSHSVDHMFPLYIYYLQFEIIISKRENAISY